MDILEISDGEEGEVVLVRKGEEKRQEILTVAERLFCLKGYRETSVQDILDVLKTSKGGFYHHFESKEMVLETLCAQRAEKAAALTEKKLADAQAPMERINAVLHGMMPLRREEVPFLTMLMPQLFTQEGRTVCLAYQDALRDAFLPLMERELDAAQQGDVICPPGEDSVADLVLTLMNRCWLHVAQLLLNTIKTAQRPEPAALMDELAIYRAALERLLDAPFGSVEIIRLDEWYDVAQGVERRIALPMGG